MARATNRWPVNEYHPVVGWVHKPNLSFNADSAESSFTTGEFGVRMNEAKILPVPRGAVLAVGNSFTEGAEVGDRGSWPASLERTLGEPVVNAGIGGWAADQIVLRAEELMSELSPKAIMLGDNSHSTDCLSRFSTEQNRRFLFFKEEPKNHWYPGAGIGISY